mmetsp:Transcript_12501/g.38647  ORF Transcript_12501/g.38647 Transcript_12501/m.38647 type:complete len:277 (+) Transcript_12501:154-984(+)
MRAAPRCTAALAAAGSGGSTATATSNSAKPATNVLGIVASIPRAPTLPSSMPASASFPGVARDAHSGKGHNCGGDSESNRSASARSIASTTRASAIAPSACDNAPNQATNAARPRLPMKRARAAAPGATAAPRRPRRESLPHRSAEARRYTVATNTSEGTRAKTWLDLSRPAALAALPSALPSPSPPEPSDSSARRAGRRSTTSHTRAQSAASSRGPPWSSRRSSAFPASGQGEIPHIARAVHSTSARRAASACRSSCACCRRVLASGASLRSADG